MSLFLSVIEQPLEVPRAAVVRRLPGLRMWMVVGDLAAGLYSELEGRARARLRRRRLPPA